MTEIKETIGGVAAEALQQYVNRIERLEEEKSARSEDIRAGFAECFRSPSNGLTLDGRTWDGVL